MRQLFTPSAQCSVLSSRSPTTLVRKHHHNSTDTNEDVVPRCTFPKLEFFTTNYCFRGYSKVYMRIDVLDFKNAQKELLGMSLSKVELRQY